MEALRREAVFCEPVFFLHHLHLVDPDRYVTSFASGENWSLEDCTCGFLYWRTWELDPEPEWDAWTGGDW